MPTYLKINSYTNETTDSYIVLGCLHLFNSSRIGFHTARIVALPMINIGQSRPLNALDLSRPPEPSSVWYDCNYAKIKTIQFMFILFSPRINYENC